MEWRVPESQSCGSGVDCGSSPFIPINSCLSSLATDCLIFFVTSILTLCLLGCVSVELCWVSGSASLLLWLICTGGWQEKKLGLSGRENGEH